MHLVLAPYNRLRQRYGQAYEAVDAALAAALAARAASGVASLSFDPELGLPELGVAPVSLTPAALTRQLAAIQHALAMHDGIIVESLWIIGGPELVPFGILPNPMRDRDGPILSDCVYGLANAEELLVHWPVGRTPDTDPAEASRLAQRLQLIARAHRAGPPPPGPALAISTARWAAVSSEVLAAAGESSAQLLLAPPLQSGAIDKEKLTGARRVYCNLHGVVGSSAWYGQAVNDSELLPALRPADLAGLNLAGTVVITQACFGAGLAPNRGEPTMATALLDAGATLIGAVGLSYGAPDPPAGESDLLALQLLAALRQPGQRLGAAVQTAHAAMARDLLRHQGSFDDNDIKTLLTFVLYGDPALPVGAQ